MPKLTKETLDIDRLRKAVDEDTFKLGHYLYQQQRVHVLETSELEATCQVQDKRLYTVKLVRSTSYLYFKCECSHASRGLICEHDVAAWLALGEHLGRQEPPPWRAQLDQLLGSAHALPRSRQAEPYLLFFSLQELGSAFSYWNIVPYYLPGKALPDERMRSNDNAPLHDSAQPDDNGQRVDVGQPYTQESIQKLFEARPQLLRKLKTVYSPLDPLGCLNSQAQAAVLANLMIERLRPGFSTLGAHLPEFLPLIAQTGAPLYLGEAANPLSAPLQILPASGEVRIRIDRDEQGLHILPVLSTGTQIIDIQETFLEIISPSPLWILANGQIFELANQRDTDLIFSILQNREVILSPEQEKDFLEKYYLEMARLLPLEGNAVEWQDLVVQPTPRLYLSDVEGEFQAQLRFGYGEYELRFNPNFPNQSIRRLSESWTLTRIQRDPAAEKAASDLLSSNHFGLKRIPQSRGGASQAGLFRLRARTHPVDFLLNTVPRLTAGGFEIFGEEQLVSARVNRNTPTISFSISSGIDWFDVQTVVSFGEIEVAVKEIRRAMRKRERFIKLADGSIGELPVQWFEQYKHLFALGEENESGIRLSRHHVALLEEIVAEADQVHVDSEYERRRDIFRPLTDPGFRGITPRPLDSNFMGDLRPYQKAGYDWLHFLRDYHFGGCLADDMGLGKTVQALAFLQSIYSRTAKPGDPDPTRPPASLLVVPRSLLINWQREASRFTPDLRVMEHFDSSRSKDLEAFNQADLVITTYGVMLRDITLLHGYTFHYAILDESQAIKNPLSQTARAARLLQAQHRLVLTGTPIENSTVELWSQFTFLNPGLLGSLEYFRNEFGAPIERKNDEKAAQTLRKLVYPFILRRTKDQVAPELPPRTERLLYSDMEPAQRKLYSRTRDYYRGMLLGMIDKEGLNSSRMKILEGLLRLRQICNHPLLVDDKSRAEFGQIRTALRYARNLESRGAQSPGLLSVCEDAQPGAAGA